MTKRNPFAKDLPEMAQGLREQATSGTEGEKGTELRPCDSDALTDRERQGFKAAIAQRDATITEALARIERLWDVIAANGATNSRLMRERDEARTIAGMRTPTSDPIQAADDRRSL